MIFVLLALIITFIIIIIFSFPQLSPIPYFPSNKKDKKLIIESLNLKNGQIIFDLGAGDGWVVFTAASKALDLNLNTKFIATEINPILLLILNIKKLFHPNRKNIKIMYADMFTMNFSMFTNMDNSRVVPTLSTHYKLQTTFYLYISPWYLEKTLDNIKKYLKQFNIVSYMYDIKSLQNKENIIKGFNNIYIYNC